MTCASISPFLVARLIIVEAARCRQWATINGRPAKPALYAILKRSGCGTLAPALDSLFTFFEMYAGHSFRAGARDNDISEDENRLLDMFQSPGGAEPSFWSAPGPNQPSSAMKIAIRSTLALMALTLEQREFRTVGSIGCQQTKGDSSASFRPSSGWTNS